MTDDEARHLATRIIDTWPTGPRAYIWRELLTPLDHELATRAYRTLTREAIRPPTPGQFYETYRAKRQAIQLSLPTTTPASEQTISRHEYLKRVEAHAKAGQHAAVEELERWLRYGRRPEVG